MNTHEPLTLNAIKNFIRGLPKKLVDIAKKRQLKHVSNSREPTNSCQSPVVLVNFEVIT